MKRQLVCLGAVLALMITFTACKKQSEETKPLSAKILGKWTVEKIQVATVQETGTTTTTTNYQSSDYMDFKNNTNNDVELKLASNTILGTFTTTIGDALFLRFATKGLDCKVDQISENKFQFTGTVVGSNPKVTETYYLYR
jgi:hypothetical protein